MDVESLRAILEALDSGDITIDKALERLRGFPYDDLGHTRLDTHRALRKGLPEVVFCQNKTPEQAAEIFERLFQHHQRVMGTRASPDVAAAVLARLPQAHFDPISRLITLNRAELAPTSVDSTYALVVSAGTSDQPVAEEAAQTLEFLDSRVERAYDVGVAGLHRVLDQRELLFNADVVISVAGMEGALTSVVSGLVSCPVIGVPTSVGYGASFEGLASLLAMLNSCAPGVAVVNIDNGFGAAQFAHMILSRIQGKQT
jgi:NCAIR mutase (PurE)-related protein